VDGALTLLANRRMCAGDLRAEARQLTERLVAMRTGHCCPIRDRPDPQPRVI
jgi:hypothetical protein